MDWYLGSYPQRDRNSDIYGLQATHGGEGDIFFDGWKEEYSGSKFPLLYLGFIPEKVWKCRWEDKERQELALSWGRGNGRGRNALRPGSGLPRRSAGSGAVA